MTPLAKCIRVVLIGFSITATTSSGAVITSGTISFPSYLSNGTFELSGSGFAVSGGLDSPALSAWLAIDDCHPCSSGFSLPISGQSLGSSFRGGSGTVGGTTNPSVLWGDLLAAKGSAFIITGSPITVNGPGTYTGTFSFTGFLCGTTGAGQEPRSCALDLPALTGAGRMSLNVVQDFGNLLRTENAVYTFTPEPSTGVLVLPALICVLGRTRRNVQQVAEQTPPL